MNLAGAIVGRPELVFLDEPTAGLDPHVRRQVWTLIRDLRAAGVAVLLTTHAMDEAEQLADRVVLLNAGPAGRRRHRGRTHRRSQPRTGLPRPHHPGGPVVSTST